MEIQPKVVLVTDPTTGTGTPPARCFGREGYVVGILGCNAVAAEGVAADIRQAGGKATVLLRGLTLVSVWFKCNRRPTRDRRPVRRTTGRISRPDWGGRR